MTSYLLCNGFFAILGVVEYRLDLIFQQLLELCLSKCYFLHNDVISTLENSGALGLSIMVVLSQCYLQRIEHISPKTFKRFVHDSYARFNNREQLLQFLDILNSQDSTFQIQYTIEFENENKQLNFLDITITNTSINSYDFKIFRKTSIKKCTDKTKLKHSTTYHNGSIQRFSFTSIQNMY